MFNSINKKEKNIITFQAQSEHVWEVREKPIPAMQMIPNWWKNIPVYTDGESSLDLRPRANITVKKCSPSIDALGAGYIVTLWSDVIVNQTKDGPFLKWGTVEPVFDVWNKQQSIGYEVPEGFSDLFFKYLHGWTIKTPKGWSCLITHPIAYQNLPFRSINGIVDTDNFDGEINTPVIFKNNFEGLIKAGTPMFQVIPIKRSSWQSNFELKKINKHYFDVEKIASKALGFYSNIVKEKKQYR